MKKPFIALPAAFFEAELLPQYRVSLWGQLPSYLEAVERAGGIPLIVPPMEEEKLVQIIEFADGLLLSGGGDIHPALYGEEPTEWLRDVNPERDKMEIFLVRKFLQIGKPVLGICRGVQVLNVAAGGSLFQDIFHQRAGSIPHSFMPPAYAPDHIAHTVNLKPGSLLASILGCSSLGVNSRHHQAVKEVAPGFQAVAWAEDGIIEAIEKEEAGLFALGIQWHPENFSSPPMARIFEAFIKSCGG
ncbi:MAG: gamma-glutamyl-gamma-aminobutyrate hydrolase family protein [Anaerolineae bacterium]|nr:gamma-glutamyl-gamma-aminobutyrate hydrolase family protein [Anaerolineae bacterium]MDW8101526.1 gamma-glutamyl-gamma-aminobutyrate hydrolase family protein [Anaerolineae bacterium]